MSDTFRIALVGAGLIGKRHAAAIISEPDVRLAAIVDPSEEGRAFARSLDVPVFEDLIEMLEAIQPDGAILATPNEMHVEQGLICVERGCAILVEKPIGTTVASALELVELAHRMDVPILVGHHRRHNPLIASVKRAIEGGKVGEIRAIQSTCWFYKPDYYFEEAAWRTQKGAGPVSVNLSHDVDLLRYFAGDVVRVQAQSCPSRRGYQNEDVGAAILTFESGAIGTITVSDSIVSPWSWEMTSGENPAYPRTSESCYQIGGSKGSIAVPDLNLWQHEKGQRDWWRPIDATQLSTESSDPLRNQIRHFSMVARKEVDPIVSGWEGVKTLQVLEAIKQSAGLGAAVEVSPLQAQDVQFLEKVQNI